jgi:uncharacterized membrane protein YbhN (UPF0104 family)
VTLVAILLLMTLTISNVPFVLRRGVLVLVGVVAALLAAVLVIEGFSRYRRRRRRQPQQAASDGSSARSWRSFMRSAEALLHGVSGGLRLFRNPVKAGESLGAGVLSWLAQLVGIWLTLRAFGIHDHALGKSAAVFLASNLIGLIQVTPGNLGTFQVAVASALSQTYGVDWYTGFTFGIVLQAIEIALGAGLGFVFLSREGLSFGEVRRGITAAEHEAAEPEPPPLAPDRLESRRLVV